MSAADGFPNADLLHWRFGKRREALSDESQAMVDEILRRVDVLRSQGWRMRSWRVTSPDSPLVRVYHDSPYVRSYREWDRSVGVRWMDHIYRLTSPWAGTIFVSEPYGFSAEDAEKLAEYLGMGWVVELHPELAIHAPGGTVAIWIRRRDDRGG